MKIRFLFVAALVLALLTPGLMRAEENGQARKFVVTYFFTYVRCPSCLAIERLTSETIRAEFAGQLGSGVLL